MVDLSQYKISSDRRLSGLLREKNIYDFQELSLWLKELPYKRISDTTRLDLVITEECGTCSSKHAFFSAVAIENSIDKFTLIVGMYKMNNHNTPGIGDVLLDNELEYIPEAHCYIRYGDEVIDVTKPLSIYDAIGEDVTEEKQMSPSEVINSKSDYHKLYINKWKLSQGIRYTEDQLWAIREKCIQNLIHSE